MPIARSSVRRVVTISGAQPEAVTGLLYGSNGTVGSDQRLLWAGADLLPRYPHTAIARVRYVQQTGFYALFWHSPNNGFGTWDSGDYSYGAHPYPCDGTYDEDGIAANGTSSDGTVHYQELAGVTGALDQIALPMEPAIEIIKDGRWYVQGRTCEQISTNLRHRVYPDLLNAPNDYLEAIIPVAGLGSAGANPAFYIGASDWRQGVGGAGRNDECTSAVVREIELYATALNQAQLVARAALATNAAVLALNAVDGITSLHYLNMNPTPTDVTDKKGSGTAHNPAWANANRPTLWEEAA